MSGSESTRTKATDAVGHALAEELRPFIHEFEGSLKSLESGQDILLERIALVEAGMLSFPGLLYSSQQPYPI